MLTPTDGARRRIVVGQSPPECIMRECFLPSSWDAPTAPKVHPADEPHVFGKTLMGFSKRDGCYARILLAVVTCAKLKLAGMQRHC